MLAKLYAKFFAVHYLIAKICKNYIVIIELLPEGSFNTGKSEGERTN